MPRSRSQLFIMVPKIFPVKLSPPSHVRWKLHARWNAFGNSLKIYPATCKWRTRASPPPPTCHCCIKVKLVYEQPIRLSKVVDDRGCIIIRGRILYLARYPSFGPSQESPDVLDHSLPTQKKDQSPNRVALRFFRVE